MNKPTYNEMVHILAKPGNEILATLDAQKVHLAHMVIGLSTELLELNEALVNIDVENIIEEFGDIEFYLMGLTFMEDGDLEYMEPFHVDWKTDEEKIRKTVKSMPKLISMNYTLLLAASETLISTAKKHLMYNKPLDVDVYKQLIKNVENCLILFYKSIELDRNVVIQRNMEKLYTGKKARYAGGYSDEKAGARADKQ